MVTGLAWLELGSVAARERVSGGVKEGASARRLAREEGELGGALEDRGGGVGREREEVGEGVELEALDGDLLLRDLPREGRGEEGELEALDGDPLTGGGERCLDFE